MGPPIERHNVSSGGEITPIRKTGEGTGDQEALYRKQLLSATQDLRVDLIPLIGTMRWPVPMLYFKKTLLHYSEEGHPLSLTIETPPLTPVVAPVAAEIVQIDTADITDIRDRQVATLKLHSPESKMTIVLKDLAANSLPDKLQDNIRLHMHPRPRVEEGEMLGYVGRLAIILFPEQKTEIKNNLLSVYMAYQPRGPSDTIYQQDVVDPLPLFHPLY